MSEDNGNGWDGQDRRRSAREGGLERHLTTAFALIMTSITIWVGISMVDLGKEAVKSSTQLMQVREDMRQLQTQYTQSTQERYTASEARRDLSNIALQLQRLEDRMDRMERKK